MSAICLALIVLIKLNKGVWNCIAKTTFIRLRLHACYVQIHQILQRLRIRSLSEICDLNTQICLKFEQFQGCNRVEQISSMSVNILIQSHAIETFESNDKLPYVFVDRSPYIYIHVPQWVATACFWISQRHQNRFHASGYWIGKL